MPLSIFATLALIAALGTTWVYWGVPRRSVAIWAIGLGAGLAFIGLLVWLLIEGTLGIKPTWRLIGDIAFGVGIAAGGVVSYVLYRFAPPVRRTGA
jgi:hypothetical protein